MNFKDLFRTSVKKVVKDKRDGMNHAGKHNGALHESLLAGGNDANHVKAVQSIARKAGLSKSQIAMIK